MTQKKPPPTPIAGSRTVPKAAPPPLPTDSGVLEIDAIDEAEWEQDKYTPQVQNAELQKLVKESSTTDAPAPRASATPPATPARTVVKRATTSVAIPRLNTNADPAAPSARSMKATVPAQNSTATAAAAMKAADATPPTAIDAKAADAKATGAVAKSANDSGASAKVARTDATPPPQRVVRTDATPAPKTVRRDATPPPSKLGPNDSAVAAKGAIPSIAPKVSDTTSPTSIDAKAEDAKAVAAASNESKSDTKPSLPTTQPLSSREKKPLSPTALARSAPPSRPTPDPTVQPIASVLSAFGSGPNSSGTSTKSALDAIRESGPTSAPTPPASTPSAPAAPVVANGSTSIAKPSATPAEGFPAVFPPVPPEPEAPPPPSPASPTTAEARATAPGYAGGPDARTTAPGPAPAPRPNTTTEPSYPVVQNPFPTGPRETTPGNPSLADSARPSSRATTDDALVPAGGVIAFLKTPRYLAIIGGAVVLLVIILVVLSGGHKKTDTKVAVGSKKTPTTATTDTTGAATPPSSTDSTEPATPSEPQHTRTTTGAVKTPDETPSEPSATEEGSDTGSGSATTEEPPPAEPPTETPHPAQPVHHAPKKVASGPTIGGKQVVLEYDNQARTSEPVPNTAAKADQASISKARQSYAAGNQRLFAGDADGAIRNYRQALSYYPAYVAGYRGLGLAYAQQGNKSAALQAFRTYISSVPNAKDAPLIRKRITALGGK